MPVIIHKGVKPRPIHGTVVDISVENYPWGNTVEFTVMVYTQGDVSGTVESLEAVKKAGGQVLLTPKI